MRLRPRPKDVCACFLASSQSPAWGFDLSKRKNETGLDLGGASHARLDADAVAELKELIAKLAESNDAVEALSQNDYSGIVTLLESFESDGAESKFILHHLTKSVAEKNPESLLRWALVFMVRQSKSPPQDLLYEVSKLVPAKLH